MNDEQWWPLEFGRQLPITKGRIARFEMGARAGQVTQFADGSFVVFLQARDAFEALDEPSHFASSLLELRAVMQEMARELKG